MTEIFIDRFDTIAYLNFFIDKGTMGANSFATSIGATNREKKVNVRMIFEQERSKAGSCFKDNLK